jgi:hypothetical protein
MATKSEQSGHNENASRGSILRRLTALAAVLALGVGAASWLCRAHDDRAGDRPKAVTEPTTTPDDPPAPPVGEPTTQAPQAQEGPSATAAALRAVQAMEPESYQEAHTLRGVDRLRKRWEQGAPDAAWNQSALDNINSELRAHELDGTVSDISCRSTLCLATMKFSNDRDALEVYSIEHPDKNDRFAYFVREGDGWVVLYFLAPVGVSMTPIIDGQPS